MDGIAKHLFQLALSMLWSAGKSPTVQERARLQSSAWRHLPANYMDPAQRMSSACALLREAGYDATECAKADDCVASDAYERNRRPRSGDCVLLTGPWSGAKTGAMLTLSNTSRPGFTIGAGHHHMDEDGRVHMSSGGPGSILGIDPTALVATGKTIRMPFWRWAIHSGAGQGVEFTRPVTQWTWDGDDADFIDVDLRDAVSREAA